ncbi:helix-turn-helix domain-containing protein [Methanolobus sediminis]|uniref:Helix-turn-helix domain-containing protein n=1 Tax=Methanolobus sediminis TaxID=3072978 RepID=A0AA51UL89_9EURY|nr:helix-turn-helix domain-containing protein [Methanolobus sediminis]WMW25337.1 helix-turn-helix domain-containing protein [Methanolobus sediminis]
MLIIMSDLHNNNGILEYLNDINEHLKLLELRIADLEARNSPAINDKMAVFLTVPDSIRKSLFAVSKLTSCTADEVSEITGRHRSIENKYLNELYRAGWLERERKGKKIYYSLSKKVDNKNNEHWSVVEEVENKLDQLLG